MPEQTPTEAAQRKTEDPLSPTAAAAHRSGAAYSADLISISRHVLYAQAVVIVMVAGIFFMAGYALGPGPTAKPSPQVEKPEPFGKPVDVFGKITYSDAAGSPVIDSAAAVILLPKGSAPADRIASEGIRVTDKASGEQATSIAAIEFLGGAYVRADELGEINLQVPSGRYHVLVISNAGERREGRGISIQDAQELQNFFADPTTLIGDRRYDWKLREIGRDTWLNISLD